MRVARPESSDVKARVLQELPVATLVPLATVNLQTTNKEAGNRQVPG